jgi:glycosyltransferase involved in cell wall biosynthesis
LFLGRIHPVKGLLDLVRAWADLRKVGGQRPAVRNQLSDWRVVIAGGDENGHRREVEAAIHDHGLQDDFVFVGEVSGNRKWEIYRDADLFVLPSRTENFGMAIAEALASGLPVITTHGTPWQELGTHHCGWWVDPAPGPLASALREATSLTDAERQEMGQRGRRLVEEHYTWPAAAQKMISVYRWMLGQGERPECVCVGNTEMLKS